MKSGASSAHADGGSRRDALTNSGPDDFPDAVVASELPGTVSLISAEGACGVEACGGLVCSLGALAGGETATVTLDVVPLAAGDVTHAAFAPAVNDPDLTDNQATEITTVLPAASTPDLLSIDRSSDRLRVIDPNTGATLATSTITLAGERVYGGNGLAAHPMTGELWALLRLDGQFGRELVTLAPATEAIAFNPEDGLLYHASGRFSLEAVDPSGPTVMPVATCGPRFPNAAALTHLGRDVLLLAAHDDSSLYGVTTAGGLSRIGSLDHRSKGLAFSELPRADLSLSISDAPDPVTVGEHLTYVLTVTNDGPDDFPGVTMLDHPPGSVSLLAAVPSQGACEVQVCGGLTYPAAPVLDTRAFATCDLD